MKKSLAYAFAALLFTGAIYTASAVDFGGMITNDSKFTNVAGYGNGFGKLALNQKNAASLWLRTPFNQKGTTYFTAEGLFQWERKYFNLSGLDDLQDKNLFAADVDLFKFATQVDTESGKFNVTAGRFFVSDLSGLVFSQTADGLLLSYEVSRLRVSAYGGYTGLLNARVVSILDPSFVEDTDKIYQLAAKYAVGALSLSFAAANQTISAQFLGAFRLENETYNRMYGELSLGGPLFSTVYYNLNGTLGFASYDGGDMNMGLLGKAGLTYYAPVKSLAIGVNGVYASGEQGSFKPFAGFTSQTATNALSGWTEYTGIIRTGLAMSLKPVSNLLLGATGDVIFNAAESIEYEGFQYGLNANWQIVSDVSLGATMYQYYDKEDSDSRNKSCIQLKAAISF